VNSIFKKKINFSICISALLKVTITSAPAQQPKADLTVDPNADQTLHPSAKPCPTPTPTGILLLEFNI
jgi:hypothetical protein